MRATIQRRAGDAADDWDGPPPSDFYDRATVPCRAWSRVRRVLRPDGGVITIEEMRAILPVFSRSADGGWITGWITGWIGPSASDKTSTDILQNDRIEIKDRLGVVLFGGPLVIDSVVRRGGFGSSSSHLEVLAIRHT